MRVKYVITLFIFLSIPAIVFAETITLTTYYPAPYGAYDRLKLVPRVALPAACEEGTFYTLTGDDIIQFCRDRDGDGNPEWGPLGGVFQQDGDNVFIDDADFTDLKVGIGDTSPEAVFEVSGSGGGNDLIMFSADDDDDGNSFIIKNDGKVGIGQPAPTSKLTVMGEGDTGATSSLNVTNSLDESILYVRNDKSVKVGGKQNLDNAFEVVGSIEAENAGRAQIRFTDTNVGGNWYSTGVDTDGDFKINFGAAVGAGDGLVMDPLGNVTVKSITIDDGTEGELKVIFVTDGSQPGWYGTYAP